MKKPSCSLLRPIAMGLLNLSLSTTLSQAEPGGDSQVDALFGEMENFKKENGAKKNPEKLTAEALPPPVVQKIKKVAIAAQKRSMKTKISQSLPAGAKIVTAAVTAPLQAAQVQAPTPPEANRAPASPQDATPPSPPGSYGLSGGWGGAREKLSNAGLEIGVAYKGDLNRVLSGGVEQRTMYLQNLDFKFNLDGEKLLGFKGTTAFVYAVGNWGASAGSRPSAAVGDLQWTSNIETFTDAFKLYEIWIQQKFADDKASLLVGIHDLNSEFYVTDSAAMFMHASFGLGLELSQSGVFGPSVFPYTTMAARLRIDPTEHVYFQTAAFGAKAGDPDNLSAVNFGINPDDGFLLINEAGITNSVGLAYKYAVGYCGPTHEPLNLSVRATKRRVRAFI